MQKSGRFHVDHASFAFFELTQLLDEFYAVPRSELPFRCLSNGEILEEFGVSPKEYFVDNIRGYTFKGNFLTAYISRELRVGSSKSKRIHKHILAKMQDLPTDIMLEVIGHVHPIDLYSLIRTSKSLRTLLLSRRTLSIWTTVFSRHEDIPAIPEGVSPPRWVTTLFAPPRCDACSVYPAMVHYTYFDRQCLDCASKEYCSDIDAVAMMAHKMTTQELKKYVRHTRTKHPHTPPFMGLSIFSRLPAYRKQDVEIFLGHISRCQKDVEESTPGAQGHLNDFLLMQAQTMGNEKLVKTKNKEFSRSAYNSQYFEYRARSRDIAISWGHRLRKLGFPSNDVDASFSAIEGVIQSNRITKSDTKNFMKYQQKILKAIGSGRFSLLQMHTYARREKVNAFYQEEIVHKFPPSLWNDLPSKAHVCDFPFVRRYIEWGMPETPTRSDTNSEVVEAIHIFVQRWFANSESLLLRALHCAGYDINESDVRATIAIAAMSVFVCPYHENMSLVGWQGLLRHIPCSLDDSANWSHGSPILEFSDAGHEIVSIVAKNIYKDACSTSIADLDAAGQIFICADCPRMPFGDALGTHFFNWRQAVEHGVVWNSAHRRFIPVSDETKCYILARQKPLMDPMQPVWACNHCPKHVYDSAPMKRANIIKHLAKIHGIKGPKFENDWIYTGSSRPGGPVFIALQPPECFICMLCPPGRNFKLYREQALKMHLGAKHHLDNPVEHTHWKILDIPTY